MKRRLIICCDGTWQDLDQKHPTNVVKMTQAILPNGTDLADPAIAVDQIIYYDEGLGTKQLNIPDSISDFLTQLGGGALGLGIDHKIQDAYRFLCLNYLPGDEIYLVGFSRGAYTVRSLAGLIYNSGLPRREYVRMIPMAYELYRDRDHDEKDPDGAEAKAFRASYGERVPIKALCCWDTVAELGIPDLFRRVHLDAALNHRYAFHDHKLNKTIQHAFHAVSIDENRKEFYYTPMEVSSAQNTELCQVWFPGGHGCVGGGSESDRGLSDGALAWMLEKVSALGLTVDSTRIAYKGSHGMMVTGLEPNPTIQVKAAPCLLGSRLREIPVATSFTDEVHISAKQRWHDPGCAYKPENLRQRFAADLAAWPGHASPPAVSPPVASRPVARVS